MNQVVIWWKGEEKFGEEQRLGEPALENGVGFGVGGGDDGSDGFDGEGAEEARVVFEFGGSV